jgi:hypothetical protein
MAESERAGGLKKGTYRRRAEGTCHYSFITTCSLLGTNVRLKRTNQSLDKDTNPFVRVELP